MGQWAVGSGHRHDGMGSGVGRKMSIGRKAKVGLKGRVEGEVGKGE